MKLSPQEKSKLDRLLPSKFSASGFMGSDTRSVEEIISEDLRTLQEHGLTHEEIAVFLRDILAKSRSALGLGVEIAAGVTATLYESRGKIPSPFIGDGVFEKGEVVVEDKTSGESFSITELSTVLVQKHAFFQGKGSPYRLEPSVIARLYKKWLK